MRSVERNGIWLKSKKKKYRAFYMKTEVRSVACEINSPWKHCCATFIILIVTVTPKNQQRRHCFHCINGQANPPQY